jgi:hypothetical protein
MIDSQPERRRTWLTLLPWLIPFLAATLTYFPIFIGKQGVNSDTAVVALQATHMLRGEFALTVWGAPYQGFDYPLIYAVAFRIVGPSPLVLLAVPFLFVVAIGYLIMGALSRYLPLWSAAMLQVLAVISPQALSVFCFGFRWFGVLPAILSVYLFDGAATSRRPRAWMFAAALLVWVTIFTDLYFLQMLPALLLFGALCCFDRNQNGTERGERGQIASLAAGTVLGLLAVRLARWKADASSSRAELSTLYLSKNASLLWHRCLPFTLGMKTYCADGFLMPKPWDALPVFAAIQVLVGIGLLIAVALAGWWCFSRQTPWKLRRLAIFALITALSSIGGFLASPFPVDIWSARYLFPIMLTLPFSVASVVRGWPQRWIVIAILPFVFTAGISGWKTFGDFSDGPVRGDFHSLQADASAVEALLNSHHLKVAVSTYWTAYRLTYLLRERVLIVPATRVTNRYAPYFQALGDRGHAARIIDLDNPEDHFAEATYQRAVAQNTFEKLQCGRFEVFLPRL